MDIPNSISSDDLKGLMDKAPNENKVQTDNAKGPYCGFTQEQVAALCDRLLNEADAACPHPVVLKALTMMIMNRMVEWHTRSGAHVGEESKGTDETAVYWLRDAGKFQAVMNILTTISVCDDDFTYIDN
jgi:hypothetical protein